MKMYKKSNIKDDAGDKVAYQGKDKDADEMIEKKKDIFNDKDDDKNQNADIWEDSIWYRKRWR